MPKKSTPDQLRTNKTPFRSAVLKLYQLLEIVLSKQKGGKVRRGSQRKHPANSGERVKLLHY